ncbi:hypothetical protein BATDEDRAFT_84834 [Batrachochytrium dendrobatidis JAM81]|uniref:Uncharacterized protein n=2 Tax=Batrachochytrium dendrobatidis TaxID=109871 RepID=F4NVL1_BATDJ|nr:uncharacterized protein BATDEDRAFT_84834 [Batrachochytrium dendrobatidis JAM81]EGF83292.1 hypothetical protein BATDEDRAFT_84834 [Batrachochytrium dendrobatidis JAM81]KAK5671530.1 hypothetical protein QVD99_002234 [Batrachochytrium dendrobatidis]OAJ36637.1 hypothetical protein BDEG_20791 [Batrachochytrium dendrobatidis JEL423]|eukprot:XP_006676048.1 hypothetical protein BATDEDRAFT_84834 [Batrachochytrium dendrobatidis JAM81]
MILSLIAIAAIAAHRKARQSVHVATSNPIESHWDALPLIVRDRILLFAGPLTLFLNGRLPSCEENPLQANAIARSVWQDAFSLEWVGDYDLLPDTRWSMESLQADLLLVKSRQTYCCLLKIFPTALHSLLLDVPMRLLWLDLLDLSDTSTTGHDSPLYTTSLSAASNGRLKLLEHLFTTAIANHDCSPSQPSTLLSIDHFKAAAASNHTDTLAFLYSIDSTIADPSLILAHASCYGSLDVTQWISEKYSVDYSLAMTNAARHGQLSVVRWLHSQSSTTISMAIITQAIDIAAQVGHLDIIQFLFLNYPGSTCTSAATDAAASNGFLDIVIFLHSNFPNVTFTTLAMDGAAANGHIDIVKFLHKHRADIACTTHAMDAAAALGRLDLVQFLHENRFEGCTPAAMDAAAGANHVSMLQWLHDNRSEGCTTHAMEFAAASGSIEALEWLQSNRLEGCTTRTMDHAASTGQLSAVHWLHEFRTEGCTTDAIDNAARGGYIDIVRFLVEHRSEGFTLTALEAIPDQVPDIPTLLSDYIHLCKDLVNNDHAIQAAETNSHLIQI